jgi:hypothetical protein
MTSTSFLDYSFISFIYNSSFINQHIVTDYITKISHIDVMLLNTNISNLSVSLLYNSFINDIYFLFNIKYLSILSFFVSSYQDLYNVVLIFSPEIILVLNDYFYVYYNLYNINNTPSSYFDSYVNNLNYSYSEVIVSIFSFFYFS